MQQQLLHVFSSGLYEACKSFTIGITSHDQESLDWAHDLIKKYDKIKYVVHQENNQEKDTLALIPKEIEPNDYVTYFHTKGVSKSSYNIETWRMCIEHHTIMNWKRCVQLLDQGYDSVGPLHRVDNPSHFSGGYWWSKYDNIVKLDHSYISPNHPWGRYGAEVWIGSNPNSKNYNLYDLESDPYSTEYKINQYVNE